MGKFSADLGLLALRLFFGGIMMVGHGYPKLAGFAEKSATFPDPLGMGNSLSMASAVGAEFFCSLLLVLGVATRLVALPLAFTMGVAFFIVHAADLFQQKELALLYLVAFISIALLGGGRFSLGRSLGGLSRWS